MSGPASDWRRWTERRLASLKTTYAMPWTRWDPNPRPFSSLKVFKPKVLFGWLWTVWARISAYWDNGITPQAGPKLRTTRSARPLWDRHASRGALGCSRQESTLTRGRLSRQRTSLGRLGARRKADQSSVVSKQMLLPSPR